MPMQLSDYVEYIRNTAQVPLPVAAFDEDWDPVGPIVRQRLIDARLVTEGADGLRIVETKAPTIHDLIQHHADEADSTQGLNPRANAFHNAAILALRDLASHEGDVFSGLSQVVAPAADAPIPVRLDLIVENAPVQEGYMHLRLPAAPLPGEGLLVGEDRYRVHARIHMIDAAGAYVMGLAVEKITPPPAPSRILKPAGGFSLGGR